MTKSIRWDIPGKNRPSRTHLISPSGNTRCGVKPVNATKVVGEWEPDCARCAIMSKRKFQPNGFERAVITTAEIDAAIKEFKSNGGQIRKIEPGESKDAGMLFAERGRRVNLTGGQSHRYYQKEVEG